MIEDIEKRVRGKNQSLSVKHPVKDRRHIDMMTMLIQGLEAAANIIKEKAGL